MKLPLLAVGWVCYALCGAPQIPKEKTSLLQDIHAVGDRLERTLTATRKESVTTKARTETSTLNSTDILEIETLSVDDRRQISGLRCKYTRSDMTYSKPDGSSGTSSSARVGKTVTVQKQGQEIVVTSPDGFLEPEVKTLFKSELIPELQEGVLPDKVVSPGQSWAIKPISQEGEFAHPEKSSGLCTFVRVVQAEGHPCAELTLATEITGSVSWVSYPVTFSVKGKILFALDIQRVLTSDYRTEILGADAADKNRYKSQGTLHLQNRWRSVTKP